MRNCLFENDYSIDRINATKISPAVFEEVCRALIEKFGPPEHAQTKEISLFSVILFTEGWARQRFEHESNARLIGIASFARYTAYIDAVRDLIGGGEYDHLASGLFDWLEKYFLAAAATTPIESVEVLDEHYRAYFNLREFAANVKIFADFYGCFKEAGAFSA